MSNLFKVSEHKQKQLLYEIKNIIKIHDGTNNLKIFFLWENEKIPGESQVSQVYQNPYNPECSKVSTCKTPAYIAILLIAYLNL